jgi:hypothetical protein
MASTSVYTTEVYFGIWLQTAVVTSLAATVLRKRGAAACPDHNVRRVSVDPEPSYGRTSRSNTHSVQEARARYLRGDSSSYLIAEARSGGQVLPFMPLDISAVQTLTKTQPTA